MIPFPSPFGPIKCGFCQQMKGMFVNEYGSTHCSGCPCFFKEGDVVRFKVAPNQTFVIDHVELCAGEGYRALGKRIEPGIVYEFAMWVTMLEKVPMPEVKES